MIKVRVTLTETPTGAFRVQAARGDHWTGPTAANALDQAKRFLAVARSCHPWDIELLVRRD